MSAPLDLNAIQEQGLPGSKIPLTLGAAISLFLPYVFGAAGIALLIYFILGGFQFITSRGDPKAIQAAQTKLTNAIIGFIVIIIAFTLVQLIGKLLNIPAFENIFGGAARVGGTQ